MRKPAKHDVCLRVIVSHFLPPYCLKFIGLAAIQDRVHLATEPMLGSIFFHGSGAAANDSVHTLLASSRRQEEVQLQWRKQQHSRTQQVQR